MGTTLTGSCPQCDRKFSIFEERCGQISLSIEDRSRELSIMLCGNARKFYFDVIKNKNLTLGELVQKTKERFQTKERVRNLLREWSTPSLTSILSVIVEKSNMECLELLITRIYYIQASPPKEYRNDNSLKNKLLNAVIDREDCQLAYFKPAEKVQGIIADLHSSLVPVKKALQIDAMVVDRKFRRNKKKGRKFFVCKREGCWSTKH